MFCNKCGTELEDGLKMCPSCGEKFAGEDKKLKIAVTVLCILLLAAVISVVVVMSLKDKKNNGASKDDASVSITENQSAEDVTEGTAQFVADVSYTVSDDVLEADRDLVVAKLGNYEMTVADLQLNYWFQVYTYYESNQENIYYGYIVLDIQKPLDAQSCTENPAMSWQQFFLNKAMTAWKSYALMNMLADEEGFTLPADHMDSMKADTLLEAQAAGYENVDDYVVDLLRKDVGNTVTAEDYWKYMGLVNRATLYFGDWYEKATPTEAEMEAYFSENEQALADSGITKELGNMVDVRHILIMVDEDTDAGWKAAETEANDILNQWQAGGATEDLFAELANKYSDDSGSNTTGGLYQDVQAGQMVEVFNDWIMDDNRKTGDTAVLKADYHYQGYHVMYFVSGQPIWKLAVQQAMISERTSELTKSSLEKWAMEQTDENLKLGTPAFE